jgi:hypothetical protein
VQIQQFGEGGNVSALRPPYETCCWVVHSSSSVACRILRRRDGGKPWKAVIMLRSGAAPVRRLLFNGFRLPGGLSPYLYSPSSPAASRPATVPAAIIIPPSAAGRVPQVGRALVKGLCGVG